MGIATVDIDINFAKQSSLADAWVDYKSFVSLLKLEEGYQNRRKKYMIDMFNNFDTRDCPVERMLSAIGFGIRGVCESQTKDDTGAFIDQRVDFEEGQIYQTEFLETFFTVIAKHIKDGFYMHKEFTDGEFYEWKLVFKNGAVYHSQAQVVTKYRRLKKVDKNLAKIIESID